MLAILDAMTFSVTPTLFPLIANKPCMPSLSKFRFPFHPSTQLGNNFHLFKMDGLVLTQREVWFACVNMFGEMVEDTGLNEFAENRPGAFIACIGKRGSGVRVTS